MSKRLFGIFGFLMVTLLFAQGATSQVILPPTDEDRQPRIFIDMSRANLMAAEDYQDLIARLEQTAYDYQTYFSEYSSLYAKKYQMMLQKLIFKISEGKYSEDMEMLSDDITDMIETFAEDESDLQEVAKDRKLYRLSRGLQHELEMLNEELVEDIIDRVQDEEISLELIQEYIDAHREELEQAKEIIAETAKEYEALTRELAELRAEDSEARTELSFEQQKALEEITKLSMELAKMAILSIDSTGIYIHELPEISELPAPPVPPAPPNIVIGPKDRWFPLESGGAGATKEFADSLKVTSKSTPIFINSETGELRVTGWDRPMVAVNFDVEIVAEDEKTARAFTDEIEVKLFSNKEGVYLTSHFPSLSDPKRKIVRSALNIRVPYANSLVCENSFGKIDLVRVEGGVKMSTDYCDVSLENSAGRIDVVNSYGKVTVADCESDITIVNSQGPIMVYGCRGKFDIDNSYAEVEATENTGPMVIRNSGKVMVTDHEGKVDVNNSNGLVTISDVVGDVVVENSFKPLNVTDVEGSVDIRASSSPLDLHDIRGASRVFSQYGLIRCSDLSGPIDFTSENGKIELLAEERLRGPSSIKTQLGRVELTFSQEADVLVTASIEGGVVEVPRYANTRRDGGTTSVELKFGKGSNKLDITGDYTAIVIADSH
ncbi:MAG: DUF4097 family beta strand repeat-containing protein [Candidatus Zixiibacteriota bacterium]